jgi:hypothetical protein
MEATYGEEATLVTFRIGKRRMLSVTSGVCAARW